METQRSRCDADGPMLSCLEIKKSRHTHTQTQVSHDARHHGEHTTKEEKCISDKKVQHI